MSASTVRYFKLGLIGYPVTHSLSPALHHAALQESGLTGQYELHPIPPEATVELQQILGRVRAGEIAGLNVTIPHKQMVLPHLDQLTPTAAAIGAVNTIYLRNGQLTGDNTDAPGFMVDLQESLLSAGSPSADRKAGFEFRDSRVENHQSSIVNRESALVLGAGGAARAVVFALSRSGWRVTVAARRVEQAELLAADFPGSAAIDMSRSIFEVSRDRLIVNTTPQGMSPQIEASPWPEDVSLPEGAMVYDLVYTPRETVLVKRALSAGLRATTGLGMLIEQAALAFEIWTGHSASRSAMRTAADQSIPAPNP